MSSVFRDFIDFCLLLVYNSSIKAVFLYMNTKNFKEIFARNLNYYMTKNHIKQIDLVNKFNLSKSTVSGWCNGIKIPRMDKIELLADFFGITKSDLIENKMPANMTPVPDEPLTAIPVIRRAAAGEQCFAENNISEYKYVPKSDIPSDGDYVFLRVTGDSMYPSLMEGDLVLVRCQSNADSGALAVVIIDGGDGVVKKIVYGDCFAELQSVNPMYPHIRFVKDDMSRIRVFGVVCRVIREFV